MTRDDALMQARSIREEASEACHDVADFPTDMIASALLRAHEEGFRECREAAVQLAEKDRLVHENMKGQYMGPGTEMARFALERCAIAAEGIAREIGSLTPSSTGAGGDRVEGGIRFPKCADDAGSSSERPGYGVESGQRRVPPDTTRSSDPSRSSLNYWACVHRQDEVTPRKWCLTREEAQKWIAGTEEPAAWTIWRLVPPPRSSGEVPVSVSDGLPQVAGERMERSIADFVRGCRVLLMDEQEKCNPDNALIAVLCDAVRLSREHCALATREIVTPPADADEALVEKIAALIVDSYEDGITPSRQALAVARAAIAAVRGAR